MPTRVHTADATVTGGRAAGRGARTDGSFAVVLRSPPELGGDGDGTNPEELFAIGYAACFESALALVGRRERVDLGDVTVASRVSLLREGREFSLAAELAVTLPGVEDRARAVALVRAAHATCPYSRAIAGNVPVALSANGMAVA